MDPRDFTCIRLDIEDRVGKITFTLPQYGNAMTRPGVEEFWQALNICEDRDEVGAVMLTGEGDAFSAGFNLKEIPFEDASIDDIADHFRILAMWWHQVLHKITRIPKPVLSAVNGVAVGSGLGMSLCSDMVICHERARFLCAWHTIGLANDATTSYSLARIVGFRKAQEIMMTNRTIPAAEAVELGIANRIYDDASFETEVNRIARELADGPTHLQAMAKEGFHRGWRQPIEEATEHEIQNVMVSVRHPYFRESLDAFLKGERKSDLPQVRLED